MRVWWQLLKNISKAIDYVCQTSGNYADMYWKKWILYEYDDFTKADEEENASIQMLCMRHMSHEQRVDKRR